LSIKKDNRNQTELEEINMDLEQIKEKIMPLLYGNDVESASVFGSYARGEQSLDSDIDIVVKFKDGKVKTLFDLIRLRLEMEDVLNMKVDVNTYDSISPLIKKRVEKEMVVVM
jgi:predicted nucleotidyltransferase